jgi:O-antigen/teichoic acid export membrane protein
MRFVLKIFNFKSELFASTFTYGLSILIKLGSTLVLTRLLDPSAYGVIGILFSVAFTVELLSDVGATGLLIRSARGDEKKFVHTVWTIRLIRSFVNFGLLYAASPVIAQIYGLPALTDALRLFAFYFPLAGLESMAFILAQRHQRAKIGNYVDLGTSAVMTIFVITIAPMVKDYRVFIYGVLLQRFLTLVISHCYYREIGVGFAFDREAAKEQFNFGKFVLPSSLLTIVLSQYDKVVLLKLFDLSLLGIYGLAVNMIGPIANLIIHNCRVVLYPRCAQYFRSSPDIVKHRYYSENSKLFAIVTYPPAVIAGFSSTIVALLYDSRYQSAAIVLMAMGIGTVFSSLQNTSENLLVAAGHTRAVLGANIVRLVSLAPTTLTGYYFFGFPGFIWGGMFGNIPILYYYYRLQHRSKLLDLWFEAKRLLYAGAVFLVCLAASSLIAPHIPPDFVRHVFHLKAHEVH